MRITPKKSNRAIPKTEKRGVAEQWCAIIIGILLILYLNYCGDMAQLVERGVRNA